MIVLYKSQLAWEDDTPAGFRSEIRLTHHADFSYWLFIPSIKLYVKYMLMWPNIKTFKDLLCIEYHDVMYNSNYKAQIDFSYRLFIRSIKL